MKYFSKQHCICIDLTFDVALNILKSQLNEIWKVYYVKYHFTQICLYLSR